jgi:hypothetical protein
MRARLAPLACLLLVSGPALSGCAPAPPAQLPDGVSVSVYQSRTGLAERRLQVSVHNESGVDLEIDGLVLESDQFAEPAVWAKDSTTIAAGRTVALPVALPGPRCGDDVPEATAILDFALPDGARGSARLPAEDPYERMPRLAAEDCLGEAAARHATISADTLPRVEAVAGTVVARLDLRVEPRDPGEDNGAEQDGAERDAEGPEGALVIEEARGTVLLSLADPSDGQRTVGTPVALTIDGRSQTSALTLTLVPARCDPHAIAEDKRGTIFPLQVAVDGTSGTVYVAAAPAVKAALYDFVRAACAD